MEEKIQFEEKLAAAIFIGAIVFVGFLVISVVLKIYKSESVENAKVALNEKACQELSLIYGDKVKVKDGFYKGQSGTVLDWTKYSDGTAMKLDLDTDNRVDTVSVKCKDLTR